MANFNPNQKRDQRGRWQKRTFLEKAFTRFFPGNTKEGKPVAPYNTAPQMPSTATKGTAETISEIKAEMERLLTWIDPQETGKFPRTIIKHIRRNLDKYESVIEGEKTTHTHTPAIARDDTLSAVLLDNPKVAVIGERAEIAAFLDCIKDLSLDFTNA